MDPDPYISFGSSGGRSSSGGSRKSRKKSDLDDNPFCALPFLPIGPLLIINPGWAIKKLEEDE
jgi:hypothetical protein